MASPLYLQFKRRTKTTKREKFQPQNFFYCRNAFVICDGETTRTSMRNFELFEITGRPSIHGLIDPFLHLQLQGTRLPLEI